MRERPQGAARVSAAELLGRSGVRVTPRRVQVVEELGREPNDATAQQLFERLRSRGANVGLATVYRTLALLSEHGAIDTLAHHAGELCYRLCGDVHHHHLVCSGCHRVVELPDCDLEHWVSTSAARHGFTATGHQVEIVGLCADCRGERQGAVRR
jgi:Fur family transcriptional regulator, ferric uptake regulator